MLLAAALAARATLTLLDQPFTALDRASIDCLRAVPATAAQDAQRSCVVADHEAPHGALLAGAVELRA